MRALWLRLFILWVCVADAEQPTEEGVAATAKAATSTREKEHMAIPRLLEDQRRYRRTVKSDAGIIGEDNQGQVPGSHELGEGALLKNTSAKDAFVAGFGACARNSAIGKGREDDDKKILRLRQYEISELKGKIQQLRRSSQKLAKEKVHIEKGREDDDNLKGEVEALKRKSKEAASTSKEKAGKADDKRKEEVEALKSKLKNAKRTLTEKVAQRRTPTKSPDIKWNGTALMQAVMDKCNHFWLQKAYLDKPKWNCHRKTQMKGHQNFNIWHVRCHCYKIFAFTIRLARKAVKAPFFPSESTFGEKYTREVQHSSYDLHKKPTKWLELGEGMTSSSESSTRDSWGGRRRKGDLKGNMTKGDLKGNMKKGDLKGRRRKGVALLKGAFLGFMKKMNGLWHDHGPEFKKSVTFIANDRAYGLNLLDLCSPHDMEKQFGKANSGTRGNFLGKTYNRGGVFFEHWQGSVTCRSCADHLFDQLAAVIPKQDFSQDIGKHHLRDLRWIVKLMEVTSDVCGGGAKSYPPPKHAWSRGLKPVIRMRPERPLTKEFEYKPGWPVPFGQKVEGDRKRVIIKVVYSRQFIGERPDKEIGKPDKQRMYAHGYLMKALNCDVRSKGAITVCKTSRKCQPGMVEAVLKDTKASWTKLGRVKQRRLKSAWISGVDDGVGPFVRSRPWMPPYSTYKDLSETIQGACVAF